MQLKQIQQINEDAHAAGGFPLVWSNEETDFPHTFSSLHTSFYGLMWPDWRDGAIICLSWCPILNIPITLKDINMHREINKNCPVRTFQSTTTSTTPALYQFVLSMHKQLESAAFSFSFYLDPKYIYIPLSQVRIPAADGRVKWGLLRKNDNLIKKAVMP